MRKNIQTIGLILTAAAVLVMVASCNLSKYSGDLFSTHQLTLNDGTDGSILSGGGEYDVGEKVTVTVEPDTGYVFFGWEGDVDAIDGFSAESATQHSFSMPGEDIELTAGWHTIGDEGPAGGLIFYIDDADEFDWIGLEAAPEDIVVDGNETFQWGPEPFLPVFLSSYDAEIAEIGETERIIGSGQANSIAIVDFIDSLRREGTGESYYDFDWGSASWNDIFTDGTDPYFLSTDNDGTVAAKECLEYVVTHNGKNYDDWFLPSEEELNEMYVELHQKGDGGFSVTVYWSSTEDSSNDGWVQGFSVTGYQGGSDKTENYHVRAVRTFKQFGN